MRTLAEIEAAVPDLNAADLDRLEARLRQVRQERGAAGRKSPTNLSEFAGVLRLTVDPLDWQRQMREEWA